MMTGLDVGNGIINPAGGRAAFQAGRKIRLAFGVIIDILPLLC
jgi:hypothetical protein